jgi:hypothetical protein
LSGFVLCIICLLNKCKKWQQTCFCHFIYFVIVAGHALCPASSLQRKDQRQIHTDNHSSIRPSKTDTYRQSFLPKTIKDRYIQTIILPLDHQRQIHIDNHSYLRPSKTDTYRQSFFPKTIKDINTDNHSSLRPSKTDTYRQSFFPKTIKDRYIQTIILPQDHQRQIHTDNHSYPRPSKTDTYRQSFFPKTIKDRYIQTIILT